ncbi:MAG: hypothetical protein KDK50_04435 [Chlamydiia bacterium]|nr:hypothetical protein [Chlamydiia bacterium]
MATDSISMVRNHIEEAQSSLAKAKEILPNDATINLIRKCTIDSTTFEEVETDQIPYVVIMLATEDCPFSNKGKKRYETHKIIRIAQGTSIQTVQDKLKGKQLGSYTVAFRDSESPKNHSEEAGLRECVNFDKTTQKTHWVFMYTGDAPDKTDYIYNQVQARDNAETSADDKINFRVHEIRTQLHLNYPGYRLPNAQELLISIASAIKNDKFESFKKGLLTNDLVATGKRIDDANTSPLLVGSVQPESEGSSTLTIYDGNPAGKGKSDHYVMPVMHAYAKL